MVIDDSTRSSTSTTASSHSPFADCYLISQQVEKKVL